MHRKLSGLLMAAMLLAGMIATPDPASAQTKNKEGSNMPKVGDVAPDFTLKYFDGNDLKDVKLSDYRGKKNVVLAFYVFAFTGGWTQQMKNFQANLKTLEASDTQVLGVSMDSAFSNKAFADQIGVTFPLLSDWGGKITREYGIYKDEYQAPRRVNFLVGKDGKIIEEQVDKDAIDPKHIVDTCARPKLKG